MRRRLPPMIILLAAAAFATPAVAASPLKPYADAVAYELDLATPDAGRSWTGTQTITVRNAGGTGALDRVWLRLWANGRTGCGAQTITVAAGTGARIGRLRRDCTALELLLDKPLPRGERTVLPLTLTITAPDFPDRFGTTEGIYLFGNALPVLAQRDRGGWRLPGYSRYGESFVSTVADFRLTLHHPAAVKVAASGVTTTANTDDSSAITTSHIRARDAAWAAGAMSEVQARTKRGDVIRAWSIPRRAQSARRSADRAAAAIDRIERRLPRYAYGELDVIVTDIDAGGGMEYPAFVTTNGQSVVTQHEVAHQWFYAVVGNDQYREPWVDEGITSFIEHVWAVPKSSLPVCYEASRLVYKHATTFASQTMTYWNAHPRQYYVVYDNPVCALQELSDMLGTKRFNRVLRGLVTGHRDGFLTGATVRREFRRAAGRRADDVWRRWALAPR